MPLHAIGFQSHVNLKPAEQYCDAFNEEALERFIEKIAALGLKILVTELDVRDELWGRGQAERDL